MIVDERETAWRKESSNELSMGPENKDSRSWNGQMGYWTWLSCMNALSLSRLAQNQQEWHNFFIWVMDGQSWPFSGQKRKGILLRWQIHTLMNVFYSRKLFYRLSERSIFTNCCIILFWISSPPQQVFFLV